jgi:hypothetical protein
MDSAPPALGQLHYEPQPYKTMPLNIREQIITIYVLLQTNPDIFDDALQVEPKTARAHFKAPDHLELPVAIWYTDMMDEAKNLIYNVAARLTL